MEEIETLDARERRLTEKSAAWEVLVSKEVSQAWLSCRSGEGCTAQHRKRREVKFGGKIGLSVLVV